MDDEDFLYHIRCSGCKQLYMVNANVELVSLTPEEDALLMQRGACIRSSDAFADDAD